MLHFSQNLVIDVKFDAFFTFSVCRLSPSGKELFTRFTIQNEPRSEKTGLRGFPPGLTQTGLCNHIRRLEA